MTDKNRAKIKDKILAHLIEAQNGSAVLSEMAKGGFADFVVLHRLTDDLIAEGFVRSFEIAAKSKEYYGDKIITISPNGHFFFREDGGFIKRYKSTQAATTWNILKIIAAVANALMIIIVSIWAVNKTVKASELEKNLQQKDSMLNMLNLKLENQPDTIKIK
jgi:hypothetical protein